MVSAPGPGWNCAASTFEQVPGWTAEAVRTFWSTEKSLSPSEIRIPHHPALKILTIQIKSSSTLKPHFCDIHFSIIHPCTPMPSKRKESYLPDSLKHQGIKAYGEWRYGSDYSHRNNETQGRSRHCDKERRMYLE
jgi:hypothetical protein